MKFIDKTSMPGRSLDNKILTVHSKQCRKLKVKK